jgi:hypothetical protein
MAKNVATQKLDFLGTHSVKLAEKLATHRSWELMLDYLVARQKGDVLGLANSLDKPALVKKLGKSAEKAFDRMKEEFAYVNGLPTLDALEGTTLGEYLLTVDSESNLRRLAVDFSIAPRRQSFHEQCALHNLQTLLAPLGATTVKMSPSGKSATYLSRSSLVVVGSRHPERHAARSIDFAATIPLGDNQTALLLFSHKWSSFLGGDQDARFLELKTDRQIALDFEASGARARLGAGVIPFSFFLADGAGGERYASTVENAPASSVALCSSRDLPAALVRMLEARGLATPEMRQTFSLWERDLALRLGKRALRAMTQDTKGKQKSILKLLG